MTDTNCCDKCGVVMHTTNLVWITTEDFEPRANEFVPDELYNKYDSLCEPCYLSEIRRV